MALQNQSGKSYVISLYLSGIFKVTLRWRIYKKKQSSKAQNYSPVEGW